MLSRRAFFLIVCFHDDPGRVGGVGLAEHLLFAFRIRVPIFAVPILTE